MESAWHVYVAFLLIVSTIVLFARVFSPRAEGDDSEDPVILVFKSIAFFVFGLVFLLVTVHVIYTGDYAAPPGPVDFIKDKLGEHVFHRK
jgi:hypothetical protein